MHKPQLQHPRGTSVRIESEAEPRELPVGQFCVEKLLAQRRKVNSYSYWPTAWQHACMFIRNICILNAVLYA